MTRALIGLASVALSVLLAVATLAGWLKNLEANPITAWVMFAAGFALVSALALLGIWTLISSVKIEPEGPQKS